MLQTCFLGLGFKGLGLVTNDVRSFFLLKFPCNILTYRIPKFSVSFTSFYLHIS